MDFRVFVEPQLQAAGYAQQAAAARVSEALGFDGFFRSDHYLPAMASGYRHVGPTDAWVTLAGLARETRSIRLGTLVSAATLRLPGPLAIQVSQVDEMSDGRVELGLGAGWHEEEHRAYGIPFPAKRFDLLEEQLQIIKGLWSTVDGAEFAFDGAHYRIERSPGLPQSRQRPHPPLIVGGTGPRRTPHLAARYADEFNVGMVSPSRAEAQFARVRAACRELGRPETDLTYSVALVTCCGATDAEVARRAHRVERAVAELRATGLAGSPAEVVDKIGRYADQGARRFYFQILDLADYDQLELIAHQVLPQLRTD